MPEPQTAVAPASELGQTFPQLPQWVTVLSAVSQPFCGSLSQLSQPLLQIGAQLPSMQLVLPCAVVQAAPQLPQFALSLASVTSQPLATLASQFA
jgi:hypothetical protein